MKTRAFTLIEVMVVLTILALIAILAYNFFGNVARDAKLSANATRLHQILRTTSDALELYHKDYGALPADVQDLVPAGYLKEVPKIPGEMMADGNPSDLYIYTQTASAGFCGAGSPAIIETNEIELQLATYLAAKHNSSGVIHEFTGTDCLTDGILRVHDWDGAIDGAFEPYIDYVVGLYD